MSGSESRDIKDIIARLHSSNARQDASSESLKVKEEHRKNVIENNAAEQDLALKNGICRWVKWVVSIYLVVIGVVVSIITFGYGSLSDSVLIALLTTTTVNILGLPYMIIKSLFPKKA